MSKTDYKMPKMPDEFEMNIELIMARNKSGFNVRVRYLLYFQVAFTIFVLTYFCSDEDIL